MLNKFAGQEAGSPLGEAEIRRTGQPRDVPGLREPGTHGEKTYHPTFAAAPPKYGRQK